MLALGSDRARFAFFESLLESQWQGVRWKVGGSVGKHLGLPRDAIQDTIGLHIRH